MNRSLLACLAFTLAAPLAACAAPADAMPTAPIVSGHRAATNVPGIPESSLQAISYAGQGGASAVEVDARWTRDGYVVVLHDATLDRTTDCTGPVEAVTFGQLRSCASWRIVPTLTNVYRYATSYGMAVNVEVKAVPGRPFTAGQARQLVRRATAAGAVQTTVWSSFEAGALVTLKAQPGADRGRFSLITNRDTWVTPAAARRIGTVVMPHSATLTAERVQAFHRAGVQVWGYPARAAADYALLQGVGVDVIVADDPDAAKAYVRGTR